MTHTIDITAELNRRIAEILVATGDLRTSEEARVNLLAEEIREAESWSMRRAARHNATVLVTDWGRRSSLTAGSTWTISPCAVSIISARTVFCF